MDYNHNLVVKVGQKLATAWGTYLLVAKEMVGNMVNVVLPSNDDRAIKRMQEQLDEKYNIYVVYKSTSDQTSTLVDGEKEADMSVNTSRDEKVFYLRLSVQIYLEEI